MGWFYGWYFRCQSKEQTIAFIAAEHEDTCSLQIITDEKTYSATLGRDAFSRDGDCLTIDGSVFARSGLDIDMKEEGLTAEGSLRFENLHPLSYDIMGPFALVPFMECRHMVGSMRHRVTGSVTVEGKVFEFDGASGYIEGDCGKSFPKEYVWTQAFLPHGGSLMLSVADIPFLGMHFQGVIAVILWRGKMYRLATYLGADVRELKDGRVRIVQGRKELLVRLSLDGCKALKAPKDGSMQRMIRENTCGSAYYEFRIGGRKVFSFTTDRAAFEYEYRD